MEHYKLALIGFGGVNRALCEIVASATRQTWDELGFSLSIVAASDLLLGQVSAPEGIPAQILLHADARNGGFSALAGGGTCNGSEALIRSCNADIVIEATPTDPHTGEPALTHCRAALAAGKHVATANKGPVVFGARQLERLACESGVRFECEGAVMSGTPVLRTVRQLMRGAGVRGFEGILNGTSNFVLGQMERGSTLADAVAAAQTLGYAEADPGADIGGGDVRLKVVILANQLLGADISPEAVACRGIEGLTDQDFAQAKRDGRRLRLVGRASTQPDGTIRAEVAPHSLPISHRLASIDGATNAIVLESAMLGEIAIVGPGAGRKETAYALLSDIVAIHTSLHGQNA